MAASSLLSSSSLLPRVITNADRSLSSTFLPSSPNLSARCHLSLPASSSPLSLSLLVTASSTPSQTLPSASSSDSLNVQETQTPSRQPTSRRKLIQLAGISGLSAVSAMCPACDSARAEDWSYGTLAGPPQWGSKCASGTRQSPIDMPRDASSVTAKSDFGDIRFLYGPEAPSFYNTGHGTMQVDFPLGTNRIQIANRTLELLQYHFHAPSEHSFAGQRSAMEAHLVHREPSTGKLAVIGVMLLADPRSYRNPCLQAGLEFGPETKTKRVDAPVSCFFRPDPKQRLCPSLEINPGQLLPDPDQEGKHKYMNYSGSLTTPPCSEDVDWFLLANPVKIPGEQVVEFMTYVGDKRTLGLNSRPIQPLNDRVISVGP